MFQVEPHGTDEGDLWLMDANGTNPVQLTATGLDTWNENADWSPDGTKIVFTHSINLSEGSSDEVWIMDANGGNQTRLTTTPQPVKGSAGSEHPAFSPDGTKIVFASDHDDDHRCAHDNGPRRRSGSSGPRLHRLISASSQGRCHPLG